MDTMHPAISAALEREANPLYSRLRDAMMDVNELCQSARKDVDRIGLLAAQALLEIDSHFEADRITAEQREHLKELLGENVPTLRAA